LQTRPQFVAADLRNAESLHFHARRRIGQQRGLFQRQAAADSDSQRSQGHIAGAGDVVYGSRHRRKFLGRDAHHPFTIKRHQDGLDAAIAA
jgi:hypothetical protein